MSEDWFQVVWIFDKAILFGSRKDGSEMERVLTAEEAITVLQLQAKQDAAMSKLLRELAA